MSVTDRYSPATGMSYDYTPGQAILPAGTAPAAPNNWLGVPGTMTSISYTVINDDHDVIDLFAFSNGPFLVQIKNGYTYLSNQPVHAYSVFGFTAGVPQRMLIPMRTRINDIITFELYDISYAAHNLVYLTVKGVQLTPVR